MKGFTQKHGIDHNETFSSVVQLTTIRAVVKLTTIRALLAVVVKK